MKLLILFQIFDAIIYTHAMELVYGELKENFEATEESKPNDRNYLRKLLKISESHENSINRYKRQSINEIPRIQLRYIYSTGYTFRFKPEDPNPKSLTPVWISLLILLSIALGIVVIVCLIRRSFVRYNLRKADRSSGSRRYTVRAKRKKPKQMPSTAKHTLPHIPDKKDLKDVNANGKDADKDKGIAKDQPIKKFKSKQFDPMVNKTDNISTKKVSKTDEELAKKTNNESNKKASKVAKTGPKKSN